MKKRYQKAPRINNWNQTPSFVVNCIKEMEKSTGNPMPSELKEIMMKVANTNK